MKDWPTHPSILIRKLLTDTHGADPLYCFLVTGTTLTMPGLRPTVRPPAKFAPTPGAMPSGTTLPKSKPKYVIDGLTPAVPVIDTPLDVLMSIPQPIW